MSELQSDKYLIIVFEHINIDKIAFVSKKENLQFFIENILFNLFNLYKIPLFKE